MGVQLGKYFASWPSLPSAPDPSSSTVEGPDSLLGVPLTSTHLTSWVWVPPSPGNTPKLQKLRFLPAAPYLGQELGFVWWYRAGLQHTFPRRRSSPATSGMSQPPEMPAAQRLTGSPRIGHIQTRITYKHISHTNTALGTSIPCA